MADNSGLIVDALERTAPDLARSIDAQNSWKAAVRKRGARVKLYRNYERGDHRANMQTETKKMLRIKDDDAELTDLNINYCKVVIDKMASRLHVSNITADNDAADAWVEEMLKRNSFDAQQSEWYRGAIRDGDSFIMVDPETLLWVSEPAYDGFSGLVIIIDSMERTPVWACKLWSEADTSDIAGDEPLTEVIMKMVVYQPDFISFWKGEEGGAQIMADNVEPVSPIPGLETGNFTPWPLGRLPIVPISNQKDNYTSYGESEIRVVIPLQDSLNSVQSDKITASKFSAFKLLWSIGFEIDVDGVVPGGVINLVLKDGSNVVTDPTDAQLEFLKSARVGQFEATDISQYTNQIEKETQQISQVSQTPIYGVTAQGNLSGEALKQLEIGLLNKIERFQHQNVDAIKTLLQLTADIQNQWNTEVGGTAPTFDDVRIIWKSAEILDINARIQTLVTLLEKAPGLFSDEWFIRRIGSLIGMGQSDLDEEVEKADNQRGFNFDLFTAANNEQAA